MEPRERCLARPLALAAVLVAATGDWRLAGGGSGAGWRCGPVAARWWTAGWTAEGWTVMMAVVRDLVVWWWRPVFRRSQAPPRPPESPPHARPAGSSGPPRSGRSPPLGSRRCAPCDGRSADGTCVPWYQRHRLPGRPPRAARCSAAVPGGPLGAMGEWTVRARSFPPRQRASRWPPARRAPPVAALPLRSRWGQ